MTSTPAFNDAPFRSGWRASPNRRHLPVADLIGRGDEKAADQAAVNAMRAELNMLDIKGTVVIGEGERDEAPMLFIGEEVGTGTAPGGYRARPAGRHHDHRQGDAQRADVISMAPRGTMLHAPDVYMDKLAIGPGYPGRGLARDGPAERVEALAAAKGCAPSDITVCVLERPRHQEMIAELRATGAASILIPDGDIAGVMHCTEPET